MVLENLDFRPRGRVKSASRERPATVCAAIPALPHLAKNRNGYKSLRAPAAPVKRTLGKPAARAGAAKHDSRSTHARNHFHRPGRTDRGPVSSGTPEELSDRHHPAPASAVRGH